MNVSLYSIFPKALPILRSAPLSTNRGFHILRTSRPGNSSFHSTPVLSKKRKSQKDFFSSNAAAHHPPSEETKVVEPSQSPKRKTTRSSPAKNSLRRVAVEAQRSRDGKDDKPSVSSQQAPAKTVTAICAAEEYDIARVAQILQNSGHELDPYQTELYPQVVHVTFPAPTPVSKAKETSSSTGDLFVFPSGTIVAWGIPDPILSALVSQTLHPAALYPLSKFEEEDLEYAEDPKKENSSIRGDRIILGTRPSPASSHDTSNNNNHQANLQPTLNDQTQNRNLDSTLAKIAFSSGLARSTKLAVLESLLSDYFSSTRSIPAVLSRGGRMPFTRRFISQKTGQLLSIRAQLNLYSELTDSLPDLFWDSRHELGLEGYYDQVGRALDINVRIKVLNEKMDYAQEIASVLRQMLSERHGVRLEWIIILLIAVEVVFAVEREIEKLREGFGEGKVGGGNDER